MFADEFGFQRHCSFLDDLASMTSNVTDNQRQSWENDVTEQIVPGEVESLADLESSLYYLHNKLSGHLPSTCAVASRTTSHYSSSVGCYTNGHCEDVQSREMTPSPTQSDVTVSSANPTDNTDQHNQSSELLDDIMECIQTVDTDVSKGEEKGKNENKYVKEPTKQILKQNKL